jgi:hypothetical protein
MLPQLTKRDTVSYNSVPHTFLSKLVSATVSINHLIGAFANSWKNRRCRFIVHIADLSAWFSSTNFPNAPHRSCLQLEEPWWPHKKAHLLHALQVIQLQQVQQVQQTASRVLNKQGRSSIFNPPEVPLKRQMVSVKCRFCNNRNNSQIERSMIHEYTNSHPCRCPGSDRHGWTALYRTATRTPLV